MVGNITYNKRKAAGVCVACGEKPDKEGTIYCTYHRQKYAHYVKVTRQECKTYVCQNSTCGKEFIGRKRRRFCDRKCAYAHNNVNASLDRVIAKYTAQKNAASKRIYVHQETPQERADRLMHGVVYENAAVGYL